MPRYVINITSNGHRLFSTSRSSIGTDKAKLQRLVNLFDILVAGAPEEEDMSMEVVLIGDASAVTCMLNGDPLPKLSATEHDYQYGDLPAGWQRPTNGEGCLMYRDFDGERFVIRVLRTGPGIVIGYGLTRDNVEVGHFASADDAVAAV